MNEEVMKCEKMAKNMRLKMLSMAEAVQDAVHWGGSFSCAEVLAVLYGDVLNVTTEDRFEKRDKFLLSKGHAALCAYAAMYYAGMLKEEQISLYRQDGSPISELMEANDGLCFETSGGSLGINPSYAVGQALLAKKKGYSYRTFVMTGDGEMDEGSVWEAVMAASQYKLDNLIMVIDANTVQADGYTKEILSWENLKERLESFGWNVCSIDGHNCRELLLAFHEYDRKDKPKAVIANTVKGKGVSFFENNYLWHDNILKGNYLERAKREVENIDGNGCYGDPFFGQDGRPWGIGTGCI